MSLMQKIENFARKHIYFTPYYARKAGINSDEPEIFNANGKRLHVFFLSDRENAHNPYWSTKPEYIFWDRYNYGLKTHFYTHYEAFNTVGKPDRKFAMLIESRAVSPKSYEKFIREKKYIENEFEMLFTYDSEILETFSNAKFTPLCAEYWYGKYDKSVTLDPENFKQKCKGISILASDKNSCQLHRIRKKIARICKRDCLADTFGTFDGGKWTAPENTLKDYMYSIIIENDERPYFFTEKITNCFASQTIPVYLGAGKIGEFFNPDGIITINVNDADNIAEVLRQCTKQEYERRLPAVIDNFERVKEYGNIMDLMYLRHLERYF